MPTICLIIAGAGCSRRFGGSVGKIYMPIGSKPVFLWAIDRFGEFREITQRLLVVRGEDFPMVESRWGADLERRGVELVAGGERRFDSVRAALGMVKPEVDLVAVHDAARPGVSETAIEAAFSEAAVSGAAILGQQVNQTLKQADSEGCLRHVADRGAYWLAQTPQVFNRQLLIEAYDAWSRGAEEPTDDAQVVEAHGQRVHVVPSGANNMKITTPEDLKLIQNILLVH